MGTCILGNNKNPALPCYAPDWYAYWEEDDDGNEYKVECDCEVFIEHSCLGFFDTVAKNSKTTSVSFNFYYLAPTSPGWEDSYDIEYSTYIPVVFSCDQNGKLLELLNQTYPYVAVEGTANGWKRTEFTLKRKLKKGESIYYGFYSAYCGIAFSQYKGTSRKIGEVFPSNHSWTFETNVNELTNPNFIGTQKWYLTKIDACFYLEYEFELEKFDYKVTAGSSANTKDALKRVLGNKRFCQSETNTTDIHNRICHYKRLNNSNFGLLENVKRSWESYRNNIESISFIALPFASRIFYRTVKTIMSFWDWLRGKIREANNVVTFYCPITLEIEMECRI